MATLRKRELAAIGGAIAVGLGGAAVALGSRGADTQFLQDQLRPPTLGAAAVERVVRTAPDPFSGKGAGTGATCTKGGRGLLGNPWTCAVRFKNGKTARLRVTVLDDGTYAGNYLGVAGAAASGCCIDLPGTR
jgi:F0F1-type ATP synthase membrane subunit c/vacuolar-type H+-ATPase subunit K